jgi:hypothetical protein
MPDQYTYFTAQEAFRDVIDLIDLLEIQHCKESQSDSLILTNVKNYEQLHPEFLLNNTAFLPAYSIQNQMYFHQEDCVFF